MAATADRLTLEDFERQFGDSKPHFEYWFGEAVQKSMPTVIHGWLQVIIAWLLKDAGYRAGSEVRLKISPEFQPIPDVIAVEGRVERPYLTKPVTVVVEILSPDDSFRRVMRKCESYAEWGIPIVVVVDPDSRAAWAWDRQLKSLVPTALIGLPNGKSIALTRIFAELDAELE
jgi:Uma2 family endonuclease